jgi:hypothetical protein
LSGRNWADPPLSALGPKLVSNLVSKRGDFSGFFRLSRFSDLLPSITYRFSSSMAWKRSSVRSRPGPPFSTTCRYSAFQLGVIWCHTTTNTSVFIEDTRRDPDQVHHLFDYLQIARFPVWWYLASRCCDRFRCMEEIVGDPDKQSREPRGRTTDSESVVLRRSWL